MTKKRGGLEPDKYLSAQELYKLRCYLTYRAKLGSNRAIIDRVIIELMIVSGLRASEVCALNIEDTPFSHKKPVVWVRNGKGGVTHAPDISDNLVNLLNAYIWHYRITARPNEPLFVSYSGKRLIYQTLYAKIRKIGQNIGIKLHPHMLRHTCGTLCYHNSKDLRFVQDQLGHSTLAMASRYAATNNKDRRQYINSI